MSTLVIQKLEEEHEKKSNLFDSIYVKDKKYM